MEYKTASLMMAKQTLTMLTGKFSAALLSFTFHAEIPSKTVYHMANQSTDAVGKITFSVNQVPDLIPTLPVLPKQTGKDLISIKSKLQFKYYSHSYILCIFHGTSLITYLLQDIKD